MMHGPSGRLDRRVLGRLSSLAVLLLSGGLLGSAASAADGVGGSFAASAIIVKYRSEGPNALEVCAEGLSRSGASYQSSTVDRSDSLDRIHEKFQLGPHRALMGAPGGESLAARRARLAKQIARRLAVRAAAKRRPGSRAGRRSSPPSEIPDLSHVYRVEIRSGMAADQVAAALAADPHVEYAQPDHLHALDQWLPTDFDDPFLTSEGSWGQGHADLWGPARVEAPSVWARTQGEGIVVAVVDSGLDRFHPDIAANVWVNPGEDLDGDGLAEAGDANGIDDDGNGFIDDLTGFDFANSFDADGDGFYDGPDDISDADPFDDRGHGTHVSGTIAAVAGNGLGIVGIAPRARIMALKGFSAEGSAPDSRLWRAVLYAAMNGADVVNNSWSCGTPCPENPLAEETLEIVEALGLVVVTSAGNASDDVVFNSPENGRRAITVGSVGVDGEISSFSNQGWLVDVVAPGGGPNRGSGVFIARRNILSLLSSGTVETERAFAVANDYYRLAGTSMAAPHVTGAVALLLSLRPELTPAQVRRLLRMSARDLGEAGRDPVVGSGLLDVASLVEEALPELTLLIESPRPGAKHDPAKGDLLLRGFAEGSDLSSIEIEIGSGLSARVFRPIESFGDSEVIRGVVGQEGSTAARRRDLESELIGDPILARWDVSAVPDGPYVVRIRAHLVDGRVAQEIVIVAIERVRPLLLSAGEEEANAPSVSRRRVFWHQDEAHADPGVHDVGFRRFPNSRSRKSQKNGRPAAIVLEREGDQRNVQVSGREIAWIARGENGNRLERCRWVGKKRRCEVEVVVEGEGAPSRFWIRDGWLVWVNTAGGAIEIEGCRVSRTHRHCLRERLLDPAASSGWNIQSFDGETLLLKRGFSDYAFCRLDESEAGCLPSAFSFVSSTFVQPFDPIHDGNLVAFRQAQTRVVFPPGCEPGVPAAGCTPTSVFSVRYHACVLDEATRVCDEVAISDQVAFDDAGGIAVSGRRIVWSMGQNVERAAIHVCEFDPELKACEDQRITGHVAAARAPAIDGARIAWEDGRLGPRAIWGFELPRLHLPNHWRAREGKRFAIPVFAWPGSADRIRFEVTWMDGATRREIRARFEPFWSRKKSGVRRAGPRRGWLVGNLPADISSDLRLRVRARTEDDLFSESTVAIEIVPEDRGGKERTKRRSKTGRRHAKR